MTQKQGLGMSCHNHDLRKWEGSVYVFTCLNTLVHTVSRSMKSLKHISVIKLRCFSSTPLLAPLMSIDEISLTLFVKFELVPYFEKTKQSGLTRWP